MSQMEILNNIPDESHETPNRSMDGTRTPSRPEEYVERFVENDQEIRSTHDTV